MRAAFLWSRTGVYVSSMMQENINATPPRIKHIQFVHRQPRYWVTNPPTIGPNTIKRKVRHCYVHILGCHEERRELPGPFNGPILQIENANARLSSSTISATDPGAHEIIALAARAPKNLKTSSSVTDLLTPHGIIKMQKINRVVVDTTLRP